MAAQPADPVRTLLYAIRRRLEARGPEPPGGRPWRLELYLSRSYCRTLEAALRAMVLQPPGSAAGVERER